MPVNMNSRFDGTCRICSIRIPAGTPIVFFQPRRFSGRSGYITHVSPLACSEARIELEREQSMGATSTPVVLSTPAAPAAVAPSAATIVEFFQRGIGSGLRRFTMRFLLSDDGSRTELRLRRSYSSIAVSIGFRRVGSISADGTILVANQVVRERLRVIARDVVGSASAYGALTSTCSFCALPLSDAGSVAVGYGPVCANRYHLPHTALGSGLTSSTTRRRRQQTSTVRTVAAAPAARVEPVPSYVSRAASYAEEQAEQLRRQYSSGVYRNDRVDARGEA